ncbi:SRPBCC family protein [Janthinobacterium fluminis]|uniref:SRPBCC family protein n=1 Tax=Janthinobacterium fluminis TaxID=2987524 RepID=A0ABT5K0P7_9BURK|nr:SRPBCC family protein [Janthinobacterium fluminis]MDC8758035.1 SRPBCC family protein [Janthinobacterium fluminis]
MKFEHLIEINDPLNPLIDSLSHEQLWRGLVLRAESPMLFVPHLDECAITARDETGFSRSLRYGELRIEDRVLLSPQQQVRYEVAAQKDISPSSLVMTIETPTPDTLWVRFQYDDGHDAAADAANAMYDDFRRSAYQESDIDTIRILRELAAQGRLDGLLN